MCASKNIYVTDSDYDRLEEILMDIDSEKSRDNSRAAELLDELQKAKVVPASKISNQVVTMNSHVLLRDIDTDMKYNFQIVYPSEADSEKGRISVLAPVGTALLGYSVGDIVSWKVPAGIRRLQIRSIIYQPQADGANSQTAVQEAEQ